jgi:hypothetical protein
MRSEAPHCKQHGRGDVLGDSEAAHQGATGAAQIVQLKIDAAVTLQNCNEMKPVVGFGE